MGRHCGTHVCALICRLPCQLQGPASAQAAERKDRKYQGLPSTHRFQAIAFETLGPVNLSGAEFISDIGTRLSTISGDRREPRFFFSVYIFAYNATTLLLSSSGVTGNV